VSQSSGGVPKVLHERLEKAEAARLAAFVFYLIKAAKLQPHTTQGLRLGHPRIHMFGDLLLKMKAKLIVELTLSGATPEEGP
jgi:hypothetical protein